jgi:hypothetical protein
MGHLFCSSSRALGRERLDYTGNYHSFCTLQRGVYLSSPSPVQKSDARFRCALWRLSLLSRDGVCSLQDASQLLVPLLCLLFRASAGDLLGAWDLSLAEHLAFRQTAGPSSEMFGYIFVISHLAGYLNVTSVRDLNFHITCSYIAARFV